MPIISGTTAALLAAGIGAAGSIGGSLLNRPNSTQNAATATQTAAEQAALEAGKSSTNFAQTLQPEATKAFGSAINYFQPLAAGDRASMMSVLGPNVKQINRGFDTALAQTREFNPRGGGIDAIAAELPFRKASSISDLFSTTRTNAAGALSNIGNMTGGLATANFGNAVNAATGASRSATDQLLSQQQQRQFQSQQGQLWGAGLYNIIKGIPFGNSNSGSGGGLPFGTFNSPD